ncbi:MAG: hypothetical protein ACRDOD_17865, partial [Streptosporangiaceae bacterium]
VLAPRAATVTRPAWAREALMSYEVSLDPWDDTRDWFTPGDGSQSPSRDSTDSYPAAGQGDDAD